MGRNKSNFFRGNVALAVLAPLALLVCLVCVSTVCRALEYNSFDRRDPFVPLVGVPKEGPVGGVGSILAVGDVVLQGIVQGADGEKCAVINGEIMKAGEKKERLMVEAVSDNEVTIRIDEDRFVLKLYP